MSSGDDVRRLHREGLSVRSIAARLGWSKSKVHRTLAAGGPKPMLFGEWAELVASNGGTNGADLDDDNADDGQGRNADPDDGTSKYRPVPPFYFAGMDSSPDGWYERFLDGNGQSCSMLDVWRHCRIDPEGAGAAVRADVDRQIAEQGWVRVGDGRGFWRWRRDRPKSGF